MDKVLVEVYVPAAEKAFDVFLPVESKLYEVVFLLAGIMTELSEGYFAAASDTILCDRKTGTILNINSSVDENSLTNGSKLMLI